MNAMELEKKFQKADRMAGRLNRENHTNYTLQYFLHIGGVGDLNLLSKKDRLEVFADFLSGELDDKPVEDLCNTLLEQNMA